MDDEGQSVSGQPVPPAERTTRGALRRSAVVAAEILVVGVLAYVVVEIMRRLYIVVIPFGIALLFTALLRPAVKRLRGHGMKAVWATWLTILLFWAVVGGIFYGAGMRAVADIPKLSDETAQTIQSFQDYVQHGPLHITSKQLDNVSQKATDYVKSHQATLTSGALSGAQVLAEGVTGAILAFFIGFFLMYDGEGIFNWIVGTFPRESQENLHRAGHSAWRSLSGYIRGTLIVAVFHGVVMGTALTVMGVPLALPLAVLIAFGSLIPLVGAVVFGAVAVIVTLVAKGPILAVIVVGILVLESQAEAHLLQPFVVGRYVHLHPLAIAIVITAGTVFGGVWGALFAVPFTASVYAAWVGVREGREPDPDPPPKALRPPGALPTPEPDDPRRESEGVRG